MAIEAREQRIKELSETLFRRGLAMTKASARQLAESLVDTEQRVQDQFQNRKQAASSYPSIGEMDKLQREELRQKAQSSTPVNIQVNYETPGEHPVTVEQPETDEQSVKDSSEPVVEPYGAEQEDDDSERLPEQEKLPLTENPPDDEGVVGGEEVDPPAAEEPDESSAMDEMERDVQQTEHVTLDEEMAAHGSEQPIPRTEASYQDQEVAETALPATEASTFEEDEPEDEPADSISSPEHSDDETEPDSVDEQSGDDTTDSEHIDKPPADDAPDEPESKGRNDLAEKHGIDINKIFNVNK